MRIISTTLKFPFILIHLIFVTQPGVKCKINENLETAQIKKGQ